MYSDYNNRTMWKSFDTSKMKRPDRLAIELYAQQAVDMIKIAGIWVKGSCLEEVFLQYINDLPEEDKVSILSVMPTYSGGSHTCDAILRGPPSLAPVFQIFEIDPEKFIAFPTM